MGGTGALGPGAQARRAACSPRPTGDLCNGIRYGLRSGCAWRLLPHDLPPWQTVYGYFWTWRRDGTWERIHDLPRGAVREQAGRDPQPSAGIVDSQSVRMTDQPRGAGLRRGQEDHGA